MNFRIFFLILIFLPAFSEAADRYWVGGTGNWSDTTHWSASSGGAGSAGVPTAADNCIFDGSSSALGLAYTVTVNAAATCLNFTMDAPGAVANKVTWAGASTLAISGSMNLVGGTAGITRSYTGTITFNSTTTGNTISTNGVSLDSPVTFNGVGGEWTLASNVTFSTTSGRDTSISNGSFVTNNFSFSASGFSASATSSVTLGSSTLTFDNVWTIASTVTLNTGTSTIVLTGSGSNFFGGGKTYYDVNFTATSGSTGWSFTGPNTFRNLSMPKSNSVNAGVSFADDQVVTGTFTALGFSSTKHTFLRSSVPGTPRIITAAAAVVGDVDFRDITAGGASIPWAGTRLGNGGGNTNITFAAGTNKYYVGNTANWDGTVWATSSGGVAAVNNFPLLQDTCIFDANSFSANGQILSINGPYQLPAVDFSAVTKTISLNISTPFLPSFYGNFTLSSNVSLTPSQSVNLVGRPNQTITWGGATSSWSFVIDSVGTVILADAVTTSGNLTLTRGTFDMNAKAVSTGSFSSNNTNTRAITSGGATMTLTGSNAIVWNTSTGTYTFNDVLDVNFNYSGAVGTRTIATGTVEQNVNFRITAGTDTIDLSTNSTGNVDFTGFAGTLAARTRTIGGSLTISAGMTIPATSSVTTFSASGTKTITTNGKTLDLPITFGGGTWQLADPLTLGSTRTLTLTAGTFDMNNKAVSAGLFNSNNTNTRSITSGGATFTLTGSGAFIWDSATITGLSLNDTLNVVSTYSGAVGTRSFAPGALAAANASRLNFTVSNGTDIIFLQNNHTFNNLDFTGFSGSWNWTTQNNTIYGSLTLSVGMTVNSGTGILTFFLSGTNTITSNSLTLDHSITIDGTGTLQLADNLTLGSTRNGFLTGGTLDLNGKNFSMGGLSTNNTNVRTIKSSINGGKIITTQTSAGAAVISASTSTNLTVDRVSGSWSIEISGNTTNNRVIQGGGKTWPAVTFTNTTANGILDFTGSNTFKSIGVTNPPQTIRFTAATTTTIEDDNGFPSGTAGNLVTIGSITAASHTLTKSGGGLVSVNYLSISRSTATPANTWYAGTTSTDGGNNSGWIFTLPPIKYWVGGTGNWSDATNHWASTSGGAPGAGNIPTSADNCIFDANSNSTNAGYTVTVDAAATCKDLNFSAKPGDGAGGTITWAGNQAMTISGSMTLLSGMTRTWTGTMTFNATTTGKTINMNGVSMGGSTNITFDGVGGEWTMLSDFSMFPGANNVFLTNGTLITGAHTLSIQGFSSTGSGTRTLDLRGGTVDLATVNVSSWDVVSSLTLIVDTSSGITGGNIVTFNGGGLTYNDVTFNGSGSIPVNGNNTFRNFNINTSNLILTLAGSNTITGNLTVTGSSRLTLGANQTISGTFSVTGASSTSHTVIKSDSSTARSITAGAISLTDANFQKITALGPAISWAGTRLGDLGGNTNIIFDAGVNRYYVGGTNNWNGTVWATTSGGAAAAANFPLPQDTVIFDANSFSVNGQTVTINGNYDIGPMNFTGVNRPVNLAINGNSRVYGNIILNSNVTTNGAGTLNFNGQSQSITSNTVAWNANITVSSPGTVTFADAFTMASNKTLNLDAGTLNLNGQAVSIGLFSSTTSNARSITSGGTTLILTGNNATIWNSTGGVILTLNDSLQVNATYNGAVGTRGINPGNMGEGNSINLRVSAGTDTVNIGNATTHHYNNVDFTGFSGTIASGQRSIFGNFTVPNTATAQAGGLGPTFAATSGTKTITTNGVVFDCPMTFSGVGGTWQLQDSLTLGSTRTLTFTAGTLNMNGNALSTGLFSSTGTTARSITSGGGVMTITGSNGTVFNGANNTGFTITDSLTVDATYSGGVGTRTINGFNGTSVPDIKVSAGTDTVILQFNLGSVDFTGFSGTWNSATQTLYGGLTLSAGMTIPAGANTYTFAGSTAKTLTSNGKIFDRNITVSSVGGTVSLGDNWTLGTSKTFTVSNGIFDLNGKTLSTGLFNSSAVTARTLKSSLPGGKIATTETAVNTVFNVGTQTNLVVDRTNDWTIEIGGNTASIRTFAGGNLQLLPAVVFTNTTSGGALEFTGSSTFKSLSVTTPPQSLRFTAGTTTTIEDPNGMPSGTAGNLVSIGSITAAGHSLAKAGTGIICSDYLNVSRSTATPANKFFAKNSTNGGNNSGWSFSSSCTPSRGSKFLPFFRR